MGKFQNVNFEKPVVLNLVLATFKVDIQSDMELFLVENGSLIPKLCMFCSIFGGQENERKLKKFMNFY
jgi:hypothetical protein